MEDKKPRNSFLKLLSEPGFDFSPYFDKAVIEWLERNMDDFLKEAPQACKYFAQEPDYANMVAQYMPLEDDKMISDFLKTFNTDWRFSIALSCLIPRLIAVGKADLTLNCADILNAQHDSQMTSLVNALSDKAILELFEKLNLKRSRWISESRCALINRLPSQVVTQVEPFNWEWTEAKDRAKIISTMAAKWPIDDIATFLQKYGDRYSALSCMNCGEKTAKSKPGYTLHRKACDPDNNFPSIWAVVAKRTS